MSAIDSSEFPTKPGETIIVRTALPDDAESLIAHTTSILAKDEFNVATEHEFDLTVEREWDWIEQHAELPPTFNASRCKLRLQCVRFILSSVLPAIIAFP